MKFQKKNGDHIPDQITSLQKKKVGSTVTSKTHTTFHLTNGETTRARAGAGEGVAKNTFSRFLPTYFEVLRRQIFLRTIYGSFQ
eukprot:UN12795